MTPLKAASRAYVNAGTESGNSEKTIYDAFSDRDQLEADDAMRAALMALAEAELKGPHLLTDEAFKAILRAIANEKERGE